MTVSWIPVCLPCCRAIIGILNGLSPCQLRTVNVECQGRVSIFIRSQRVGCLILSYSVLFCHILSNSVLFCLIFFHILSVCLVLSHSVLFCHILSCSVLFCHIMSYSVLFYLILSYSVIVTLVMGNLHVCQCVVT